MLSAGEVFFGLLSLLLLYLTAQIFGKAVEKLPSLFEKEDAHFKVTLPAFLGMMIAGIVAANLPGGLTSKIPYEWSKFVRKAVLGIILSRAGLSMDFGTIKQRGISTLFLAVLPNACEACLAATMFHLLRPATSWAFCFCLGFVLSPISPGVVVPSLVVLQEDGYGVRKGIPTMILVAASLDDILGLCGFGVSFNVAFSQIDPNQSDSIVLLALNAPISIVGGVLLGICVAYCQYFLTQYASSSMPDSLLQRICLSVYFRGGLLLVLSIAIIVVTGWAGFSAAGYLAVMVGSCTLANLWNGLASQLTGDSSNDSDENDDNDDNDDDDNDIDNDSKLILPTVSATPVSLFYKTLWLISQPLLFMLIGAQVFFRDISAQNIQVVLSILAAATSFRLLVTFCSASLTPALTLRERLFVCVAWLPKATVQGAIGSLVLDAANELSIEDDDVASDAVEVGEIILTLAVLAILITAPVGAVCIFLAGPKWLTREEDPSEVELDSVSPLDTDERGISMTVAKKETKL